jgi:hypothetical protein
MCRAAADRLGKRPSRPADVYTAGSEKNLLTLSHLQAARSAVGLRSWTASKGRPARRARRWQLPTTRHALCGLFWVDGGAGMTADLTALRRADGERVVALECGKRCRGVCARRFSGQLPCTAADPPLSPPALLLHHLAVASPPPRRRLNAAAGTPPPLARGCRRWRCHQAPPLAPASPLLPRP